MSFFQVGVFQNRVLLHVISKKPNFTSHFLSDFTERSKHIRGFNKFGGFIEHKTFRKL